MSLAYRRPSVPFVTSLGAVHRLLQEKVVALPTETVYGLAGNAYTDKVIQKIFFLKKRPNYNPLIVHYAFADALEEDVFLTPLARQLAEAFWPGPLTLVLERIPQSRISPLVSPNLSTIAVRVPSHKVMHRVLDQLPFPLAAPSANPSGRLSPTCHTHVQSLLPGLPCVEAGRTTEGVESTVIDARTDLPIVLRHGAISEDEIEACTGKACKLPQEKNLYQSPGMLLKHYAPNKPLRLNANFVERDEGLLAFGPHSLKGARAELNLSPNGDLREAAHHLFHFLHCLDIAPCQRIAVMPFPEVGLGKTLNDRLKRAANV